LEFI
jgi:threonine synthase